MFASFKQDHELKVYNYSGFKPYITQIVILRDERGTIMKMENPRGMARDTEGNIYITDSYSHKLYKFDMSGQLIKSTKTCGKNFGELHCPKGIMFIDNCIFVCDLFNQRVQCFSCADLRPIYAFYILKKSNICPFHIACGTRRSPAYLYITGTNRIYICKLSGTIEDPEKVEIICSVVEYKEKEKTRKFQRIGGIAVKEYESHSVKLIVSETFQNSVLVLELTHYDSPNEPGRHRVPELLQRFPDPDFDVNVEDHKEKKNFELDIVKNVDGNGHGDPRGDLKKPHPVVVDNDANIFLVSSDEKEKIKKIYFYSI